MNKFLTAAVLITLGSWVTACNTTRGIGEDVEATGEAVQDAAESTEEKLEK